MPDTRLAHGAGCGAKRIPRPTGGDERETAGSFGLLEQQSRSDRLGAVRDSAESAMVHGSTACTGAATTSVQVIARDSAESSPRLVVTNLDALRRLVKRAGAANDGRATQRAAS
jgi:hypothetical protein